VICDVRAPASSLMAVTSPDHTTRPLRSAMTHVLRLATRMAMSESIGIVASKDPGRLNCKDNLRAVAVPSGLILDRSLELAR
jgi:hypothetical protein